MTTEAIAERLAAELRPLRLAAYKERLGQLLPDDVTCTQCLKVYDEQNRCEFSPRCTMTTDITLRGQEAEMNQLEEDERNLWWTLSDPIAWAKVEIDWDPRWYQIEPLRCTSRKKIFRMGRQIGKTEILSVLALYHLATQPNFRVVILAPYQDQVDLIFSRLRKFIQRSPDLSDPDFKIRDKMNPHEIEFYHPEGNSSVIGITAGVRTGQKGDKARGQTPNLLIMDEADMLDDGTLEAILAMLTGQGHIAQMVVSSTPTGRRGLFHKWCTNKKMDFREFHFTSMVSPHWDAEMELFYRETYSENGFAHEFMAEFGEMEIGLFQHKHIEKSLRDYSLVGAVPRKGEMYTFGVDWNRRGIGVHIVVVGYEFTTQKYRMAYKETVDAGEFTQHKAIERIAALNEVWNPEYIYVDEGDGTSQIEDLKIWGMNKPASRLHRKVVGVDFGSTVLIHDPMTNAMIKKQVKPFMVDLCVRRVEGMYCEFPRAEDFSTGLVGQMRDFCIVRYGRDGRPVFSDDKEHTLIAWMLGIYAIVIEFSDISKGVLSTKIVQVGHLGEKQATLITRHKVREMRERQKRLTPVPRTFSMGQLKAQAEGITLREFLRVMEGNTGRSFRDRVGFSKRTVPGHLGRPTWDRSRVRGIWGDMDKGYDG